VGNVNSKSNSINKWANELKKHFSSEEVQMVNKCMKKCSAYLTIREMQSRTTLRFYLTTVGMAFINKTTTNADEAGVGGGTLIHCYWECKLVQPLWKLVWRFIKKLKIEPGASAYNHAWEAELGKITIQDEPG
jgi:hypothetical protein